ncbi:unnamed protein product, partial [Symbiodinium sp. CCMP2456]
ASFERPCVLVFSNEGRNRIPHKIMADMPLDLQGAQAREEGGVSNPAGGDNEQGQGADKSQLRLKDEVGKEEDACQSSAALSCKYRMGRTEKLDPPPYNLWATLCRRMKGSGISIDTLSLDMTNAFAGGEVLEILVTAITMDGAYIEGAGFWTALGENTATHLVLQLDRVRSVIDVYQPPTSFRTSDRQSQEEVVLGVGDGWLDVIALQPCAPPMSHKVKRTVIVDAAQMVIASVVQPGTVSRMFYTYSLESVTSYRIVTAEAYPQNFDVSVEYLSSPAPVILGFSVVMLPTTPMKPRVADDRLLYFTTDFVDVGYHQADMHTLPSEAVDRQISLMWRWDLGKLPNRTIRIHIDPTVPLRWQAWVKEGVEAWNSAFATLRMPSAVRAVLPSDDDWPQDYSMADARYNTIYWSLSDDISSEGDAQVDPRTGEIIKADIRMGSGWVWAWLSELDLLAANATREDRLALLGQGRFYQMCLGFGLSRYFLWVTVGETRQPYAGSNVEAAPALNAVSNSLRDEAVLWSVQCLWCGEWDAAAQAFQKAKIFLGTQLPGRVVDPGACLVTWQVSGAVEAADKVHVGESGETSEAWHVHWRQVLMGEGLKSVVMHEMGHILGLRHNFKGSTFISENCLENRSCTAVHGLSASIMDYLPMNLPEPGREPNSVHIFPPTIGAYDKLAIRYGYSEPSESPTEAFYGLAALLEEAKAFDVCYDADAELGEDPFCMTEDLGEDPVAFHEKRLTRIARVQGELHKRYVQADGPWRNYGNSLGSLLREAEVVGLGLIPWVGGIRNSYAHRGPVWNASKARRPVPLQMQRRALEAVLKLLRPDAAGLLPPAEALPFAVTGEEDSLKSLDLVRLSENLIKKLLAKLLSSKRLLQELLVASSTPQSAALLQKRGNLLEVAVSTMQASDGADALSVEEFLTRMSDGILGGFHLDSHPEASASLTAEMTLQLEFVRSMTALYHEKDLPASLEAQLLLQLHQLRRDIAAEERRLRKAGDDSIARERPTLLEVHVTLLKRELVSALCGKGDKEDCKEAKSYGHQVKSMMWTVVTGTATSFVIGVTVLQLVKTCSQPECRGTVCLFVPAMVESLVLGDGSQPVCKMCFRRSSLTNVPNSGEARERLQVLSP